jgi:hypothetical protein
MNLRVRWGHPLSGCSSQTLCKLLDNAPRAALAAALEHLQGLEHLSLSYLERFDFPTCLLQPLQQLTCLELAGGYLLGTSDGYYPIGYPDSVIPTFWPALPCSLCSP